MERFLDGCCHYIVGWHGEGSMESSRVALGIPRGNCGSFRGGWPLGLIGRTQGTSGSLNMWVSVRTFREELGELKDVWGPGGVLKHA